MSGFKFSHLTTSDISSMVTSKNVINEQTHHSLNLNVRPNLHHKVLQPMVRYLGCRPKTLSTVVDCVQAGQPTVLHCVYIEHSIGGKRHDQKILKGNVSRDLSNS